MIELLNVDCLEYMKGVPDKYFELAIVDPPYNVGLDYNTHDDKMEFYYDWCEKWFNELIRTCNCILITPGVYNIKFWINKDPVWQMIWYKSNSCTRSKLKGYMLYEPIMVYGEVKNRIYKDVIQLPISIQEDADFHPCPKPMKLWERLLNDFGFKGCKIFEPFMGSGTGSIAAKNMGFDYVGCEIDKDYYDAGVKRFKEQTMQQSLFNQGGNDERSVATKV